MTKPIILLILKALEGRGAERMVTMLARAYVGMDYYVHVLCLENTQKMPLDDRVVHHIVPYKELLMQKESEQAAVYQSVAKRIDEYILSTIGQPNLILVNIYKLNWIMAYSQLPNIINVLHTALSMQFQNQLATDRVQTIKHLKRVYGAHPCSCVSDGAREDLLRLIGDDLNKTMTIYNPCDIDYIKQAAHTLDIKQFNLSAKGYIIHVASFDTMKGHQDLLHAYAKTERKLPLVLVGEGKLKEQMEQLAIELNIDDKVKFLGFQANPYPLIAGATLLVLTSKFEGFGYVIVEAQALSTAVISTDCPFGPRELLPSKNLVPVGDIEALARLINRALDNIEQYKVSFNEQLLPNYAARQYLEFGQVLEYESINKAH